MRDPPEVSAASHLSSMQNPYPLQDLLALALHLQHCQHPGLLSVWWPWSSKLRYLITSPPARQLAFAFPLHPPPPQAHFELVVASAALSFGVSQGTLLPSANCQYLSWHPISTIHTNDCERCIHFHFLKGFRWLKPSRRVRLGRVAGDKSSLWQSKAYTSLPSALLSNGSAAVRGKWGIPLLAAQHSARALQGVSRPGDVGELPAFCHLHG